MSSSTPNNHNQSTNKPFFATRTTYNNITKYTPSPPAIIPNPFIPPKKNYPVILKPLTTTSDSGSIVLQSDVNTLGSLNTDALQTIITKKSPIVIMKGTGNHPLAYGKFFGICCVDQECITNNDFSYTNSLENSLCILEPDLSFNNERRPLEILKGVLLGEIYFRIKVSPLNTYYFPNGYLGYSSTVSKTTYTGVNVTSVVNLSIVNIDIFNPANITIKNDQVTETLKGYLFRLNVDIPSLTDLPLTLYNVFAGKQDISITNVTPGTENPGFGMYLGVHGYGKCKSLSACLTHNEHKFKLVSTELSQLNCCIQKVDFQQCVTPKYWNNVSNCSQYVTKYCKLNPDDSRCVCVNSPIPYPHCFDSKCFNNPSAFRSAEHLLECKNPDSIDCFLAHRLFKNQVDQLYALEGADIVDTHPDLITNNPDIVNEYKLNLFCGTYDQAKLDYENKQKQEAKKKFYLAIGNSYYIYLIIFIFVCILLIISFLRF